MSRNPQVTEAGNEVGEILEDHDLPKKLIPGNVTSYDFNAATGRFKVLLSSDAKARFGGFKVVYGKTLTGTLQQGLISDLKGVKVKVGLSLSLKTVRDKGDKLAFGLGKISKQLPRSAFD